MRKNRISEARSSRATSIGEATAGPCQAQRPNLPSSQFSFTPIIITLLLLYNSEISSSATALVLIVYSCIGIIVRCAVQ